MVYIGLFVMLAIFSFCEIFIKINKRKKYVLEIIILLICIFISSIRTGVLGDYIAFQQVFDGINVNLDIGTAITTRTIHSTEWGYNLLNYIVKKLGGNFQVFICVEAIIVNILFYLFCKNLYEKENDNKDYTLTQFFAFYSMGLTNIYIVRQAIAVCICLYSYKYIKRKNLFKFILCVIVAGAFHRTAYIWIIAYFIYHIKAYNTGTFVRYVIFCIGIGFIGGILVKSIAPYIPGIAGEKLRLYIEMGINSYGGAFSGIIQIIKSSMNIVLILFIFSCLYNILKNDNRFVGCFNIYLVGVSIMIISFSTSNQLARMATPFISNTVFLYTYLFKIRVNKNFKYLIFLAFVLYLFLRMYMSLGGYEIRNGYQTIWGTF